MSTIISSSSYISIIEENNAELILRNSLPNLNTKPSILLFKVKTNIIQNIDVRPAYGYIVPDKTKTLYIKYIGKIQNISKTKLQVSWISTKLSQETIDNKKMTSNQFTQFYKNQKIIDNQKEQYLTIPFKHSLQQQKKRIQKEDQVLDLQQAKIIKQQKNQPQTQEQLELKERKKIISDFKSVTERNSDESSELSDSPQSQNVKESKSKNKVLYFILILIVFGMGILIGIKIQKLKNNIYTVQLQDVSSVIPDGESQETKVEQANNQSNVNSQINPSNEI